MYQPLLMTLLVFAVSAMPAEEIPAAALAPEAPLAEIPIEEKIPVAIQLKSNEEVRPENIPNLKNLAAEEEIPHPEEIPQDKSDLSGSESYWGGWRGGWGGGWGGYGGWGGRSYYPRHYGGWGYPSYGGWRRSGYWG